jgi:hypothetical protein
LREIDHLRKSGHCGKSRRSADICRYATCVCGDIDHIRVSDCNVGDLRGDGTDGRPYETVEALPATIEDELCPNEFRSAISDFAATHCNRSETDKRSSRCSLAGQSACTPQSSSDILWHSHS